MESLHGGALPECEAGTAERSGLTPDATPRRHHLSTAALIGPALGAAAAVASAADESAGFVGPPVETAPPAPPPPPPSLTLRDAARFLTQATFGITGVDQITVLQAKGLRPWIDEQMALPAFSHSAYVESQRGRDDAPADPKTLREEYSYEAF